MAQIGVHVVREVERRGASLQLDHFAARRQRVDAVLEHFRADAFEEIAVAFVALAGLEQLAQPDDLLLVGRVGASAFLVAPVRGDAQLGVLVHLARADLDFERQLARADHRRVQRAIGVVLRRRDVVVELAGDVRPQPVHDAERGVAVRDRRDQHAHGAHVEQLIERQPLALALAPDAVDVFRAPGDVGVDLRLRELLAQGRDDILDVALAVDALGREPARDTLVIVRLEVAEAPVFELPLDLPHAQAVGERRIDLAGLVGQPLPLGLRRILAFAQLVELGSELDQHQSRIGDDREQHLAQAFRLVAGRSDVQRAQPQQLGADARGRRSRQLLRPLDRQRVRFQQREQHRARQDVFVVRQLRDDVDDRMGARDARVRRSRAARGARARRRVRASARGRCRECFRGMTCH